MKALDRFLEASYRDQIFRDRMELEADFLPEVQRYFRRQQKLVLSVVAGYSGLFRESFYDDLIDALDKIIKATGVAFQDTLEEHLGYSITKGNETTLYHIGRPTQNNFVLDNPRAVGWSKTNAANDVSTISETTRAWLRKTITNGIDQGASYKDISAQILQEYADWARKPRGPKHIKSRAELITITEIGNAYSEGNRIAVLDLLDDDDDLTATKRWKTSNDSRVSDGCRENAAKGKIAMNELYPSGHMRPLRFPGCRCYESYEIS